MKVCLVNPTGVENTNASYPHGIIALHAAIKDAGHEVEIFDCCLPGQNPSTDYLNSFDVVGISVMTTQLLHGMEIANSLNKEMEENLQKIIDKYDFDQSNQLNNNLESLGWDLYLYRQNME